MRKYFIRAGVISLGAVLGYLYYYYVGCRSGTCPITGNPWVSTGYGALFGLVLSWGKSNKKEQSKEEN